MIAKGDDGQISGMYLLRDLRVPILTLTPASTEGRWEDATYSGADANGRPSGEIFRDIDYDGHFDVRFEIGRNSKVGQRSIVVGNTWLPVISVKTDDRLAIAEGQEYVFTSDRGWIEKR